MGFKFGDILENGWAAKENPIRTGIFVRNTIKGFQMTNGKGRFWVINRENHRLTKIGTMLKGQD
ncbi:hypothetical protein [Heyndrickxia coagulans]|uniref:hypothetical protein n=1 Tax=Heyndrickxia coagulans TaxID=1398 RepID=UPI0014599775|nr:hypothetical protein [Heyndrickxia coagulans]NMH83287.1 hypothetical protein [Heyndrickxia coagulans]